MGQAEIETAVGEWGVLTATAVPAILEEYRARAGLVDQLPNEREDDGWLFVGVARPGDDWPSLVVTQGWGPTGAGFRPGVLVVPETGRVLIGAGTRIACYQHDGESWRRQWLDTVAYPGFWSWRLHADVVVMAGEVEIGAWTTEGERLWAEAVEPPWSYEVVDGTVFLDVDGRRRSLPLRP